MSNKDILEELQALEKALDGTLEKPKKIYNPAMDFLTIQEKIQDLYVKSAEADIKIMKLYSDFHYEQARKAADKLE